MAHPRKPCAQGWAHRALPSSLFVSPLLHTLRRATSTRVPHVHAFSVPGYQVCISTQHRTAPRPFEGTNNISQFPLAHPGVSFVDLVRRWTTARPQNPANNPSGSTSAAPFLVLSPSKYSSSPRSFRNGGGLVSSWRRADSERVFIFGRRGRRSQVSVYFRYLPGLFTTTHSGLHGLHRVGSSLRSV